RGIAKNESIIELEVFDEIAGCFVIGIGLAREADNDVGRQRDPWAGGANFVDQLRVFFCRISPVHRLENSIRSRLQRQMPLLGQFRQVGDALDQVITEADRMRRGKAQTFQPVDRADGFEQLHEWALLAAAASDRGYREELVATIEVHDLAK